MIGYNVEKINELMASIANYYNKIGDCMASNWSPLVSKMQSEWVGPDEISFQNETAKRVRDLYADCKLTVDVVINNIKIMAQDWREFQETNILTTEGGASSTISKTAIADLEIPTLNDYPVENIIKDEDKVFGAGVNLGLTNGTASAGIIQGAMTQYVQNISNEINGFFRTLDASSAFLGSQASSINEYLGKIGESLKKLTSCVKDLHTALQTAAGEHYGTKSESIASSASSAEIDNNFNDNNLF